MIENKRVNGKVVWSFLAATGATSGGFYLYMVSAPQEVGCTVALGVGQLELLGW